MNKRVIGIFLALLFLLVGYAVVTANLFVNSSVAIGFDEADFNIFFSKIADGNDLLETISEDGDSFTYNSTGNNMISYSIINRSVKYDAITEVICDHNAVVNQEEDVVLGGTVINGTISSDYVGCITCNLNSTAVARNENSESDYNVHKIIFNTNGGIADINEFFFVENYPIGELPIPTKEGYNFVGWFNKPEGEEDSVEITKDTVLTNISDITVYARWVQSKNKLYDLIKKQASTDTIDFSVNSMTSGTNGIYTTIATEGNVPVYYYRGAADQINNNVIFNNMCWKIIRTTETGGVKLIYNGTPNADGECVATGTDTQIGTSAFNDSYINNAYVGYMYGNLNVSPGEMSTSTTTFMVSLDKIVKYSTSYYFDNNLGKYVLDGTITEGSYNTLGKDFPISKYSCKNDTTSCDVLYRIDRYSMINSVNIFYYAYTFDLIDSSTYTVTHENSNNSTIKTYIDTWYTTNFDAEATAKLEDTVFCNDRSTVSGGNNNSLSTSYGTLGYGKNDTAYGATARSSYYTLTPKPSLVCTLANDKFTVSSTNGNGKLMYPVGLITLDEVVLAGYNTYASNKSDYKNPTNYLHTGSRYWTFSPDRFTGGSIVGSVGSEGSVSSNYYVINSLGVRPVVSLAEGTLVEPDGEGTSTKPYVVK